MTEFYVSDTRGGLWYQTFTIEFGALRLKGEHGVMIRRHAPCIIPVAWDLALGLSLYSWTPPIILDAIVLYSFLRDP